jgi:N-acetylmuramoyl-L-alanine amidase
MLIVSLLAGCRDPQLRPVAPGPLEDYEAKMSVHELGRKLGMRVESTNDTYATLAGGGNTLVLFSGRNGGIYVNGQRVRQADNLTSPGGIVHVPRSLLAPIRQSLPEVDGAVTIAPPTQPVQPTGPIPGLVILDPGHGGRDPGALGRLTPRSPPIQEKAINLQLARKVASNLKTLGVRALLTRYRDTAVSLDDRAKMANTHSAKLFVSLHANFSQDNPQAKGFQIYIATVAGNASKDAAKRVAGKFKEAGLSSHGDAVRDDRDRALAVLRQTRGAAILIEVGFMSNPADLARIVASRYQDRLAYAIAAGIASHLRAQQGAPAGALR